MCWKLKDFGITGRFLGESEEAYIGMNEAFAKGDRKYLEEICTPSMYAKLKGQLKEKIANTPGMANEKKKEIEGVIVRLDSASEGMMVWMRKFNPLPDSLGEEQAKEYLEGEMEKIKKVREDVRKALEDAVAEAGD